MSATTDELKITTVNGVKSVLDKLRASPKLALAISAAAAISLIVALMFWAREPDYRVLFDQISDEDGGEVVSQLAQMNVPYRVSATGGVIMVPQEQVHELRMRLAQLGLPKGGAPGFELLDREKFGISQFSEQVNYQRALEGELARSIENLGPIRHARVHLAVPKPSMFVREKKQPTAAVRVTLARGRSLDDGQVEAIVHLVSGAVPGLSGENVTLVDQLGNLLTQGGTRGQQSAQLKHTLEIEADYQQRIQRLLAPLVGENNVRTQVTAQLDYTRQERTDEQYQPNSDPDKMAVRSRQSSQSAQGDNRNASGVPGMLSNLPPTPASAPLTRPLNAADKNGEKTTAASTPKASEPPQPYSNRNDETTNFEVGRTLIHTKTSEGSIQRLSVAIVINHLPQGEEGKAGPLPEAELERMQRLVEEAIGFSASRGDSIDIVNSPFNGITVEPATPFWQQQSFHALLMAVARYVAIALIAWVLWRRLVQPAWTRHQEVALRRLELEKQAHQRAEDEQQKMADVHAQAKARRRVNIQLNGAQLRELAAQEPRVIALVIRQWMNKEHQ